MKFKFGVDSFIWAEDFKEKDLWIIEKAKEMIDSGKAYAKLQEFVKATQEA